MATDAAILTAARTHSAAIAALKEVDATVARLQAELQKAGQLADEKRKYANECQRHLLQLAAQKPTEPAPKPVETAGGGKLPPPEPIVVHTAALQQRDAMPSPVPNLSRKR